MPMATKLSLNFDQLISELYEIVSFCKTLRYLLQRMKFTQCRRCVVSRLSFEDVVHGVMYSHPTNSTASSMREMCSTITVLDQEHRTVL